MNLEFIQQMSGGKNLPDQSKVAKAIVEKWDKIGLLKKLKGQKKTNMALLFETEAKELRQLNEQSSVADIAGFNKIAFPLVRRVFAQLIANEIVSVQPMSLPSGLLFYLDFQYDRNRAGFTTGGSVYGSRGSVINQQLEGVGPQQASGGFFELNSGYSSALFQLSSASAVNSGVTATSGRLNAAVTGYNFTLITPGATDLAQLHNIRAASSGELVKREGTFRGLSRIESLTADSYYGTIDPTMTHMVDANTVRVYSTNGNWGKPLGAGALSGIEQVVIYGPARSDLQDNPKTTSLGDFEAITGIPEVNISISSVPVMADARKLKTKWTPELAQDINAYHALDAEVELTTILSELIALEIDREILGALLHGATVKAAWSRKLGRYVSLSADGITVTVNNYTSASQTNQAFYGTQQDWYQTLGEVVTQVSNEIHKRSLRHGANFLVTSPEVSTILESINGWKPNLGNGPEDVEYSMGLEKAGTLSNRYTVYKDPYFPVDRILLGYKGGSFLDSGFVYAPYVPLLVTPTIFGVEDFVPRKAVMTRYAKQMIRPEFYGTITVLDIDWIGMINT